MKKKQTASLATKTEQQQQDAQQHFLMRTFLACSNIPHWQHLDASAVVVAGYICCRYTWLDVVIVVAGYICWLVVVVVADARLLRMLLRPQLRVLPASCCCLVFTTFSRAIFQQFAKSFVYFAAIFLHTAPQSAFVVAGAWYMPKQRRSARAYLKNTFHNNVNL